MAEETKDSTNGDGIEIADSGSGKKGENGISIMNTADWRWAAVKGFWDPLRRCWNSEMGGMTAYLSQRNQRLAIRKARKQRAMRTPKSEKCHQSSIRLTRPLKKISKRQSAGQFSGAVNDQTTMLASLGQEFRSNNPSIIFDFQDNWGNYDFNALAQMPTCRSIPGLLAQSLGTVWPQPVCRRYWSLGYQAEPIIEIFHQLPTALRDAIGEALDAIQNYADTLRHHAICADPAVDVKCGHLVESWENDDVHAFIRVDFAPDTHERVAVHANARAADLLGMRHEELLARYARNDVPLALPPLDVLCGFLHSLRAAYSKLSTRYARILVPGGAALVRVSSAKAFDPLRQLRQVPPVPLRPAPCPPNPAL
jgi:hypothetical protein